MAEKRNFSVPVNEPHIYIFGSCQIQNELLAYFINQKIKIQCSCHSPTMLQLQTSDFTGANNLVLCNCLSQSREDVFNQILPYCSANQLHYKIALVNAGDDSKFLTDVLNHGVKGVFFTHDSLDILEKGLQAILNGDLWYSRGVMASSLQIFQKTLRQDSRNENNPLTRREHEILSLIASGALNNDISEQLHISPYTVKTHINNIYRKIKAPNRVQAVLWAAKNL